MVVCIQCTDEVYMCRGDVYITVTIRLPLELLSALDIPKHLQLNITSKLSSTNDPVKPLDTLGVNDVKALLASIFPDEVEYVRAIGENRINGFVLTSIDCKSPQSLSKLKGYGISSEIHADVLRTHLSQWVQSGVPIRYLADHSSRSSKVAIKPEQCRSSSSSSSSAVPTNHTKSRDIHNDQDRHSDVSIVSNPIEAAVSHHEEKQNNQHSQSRMVGLGALASTDQQSTLGKRPQQLRANDSNRHSKDTDNKAHSSILCQGCNRLGHTREICTLYSHPDFVRTGNWAGSATDRTMRAYFEKSGRSDKISKGCLKLTKHLRADGTRINDNNIQSHPPTPSRDNDSNNRRDRYSGDRSGRGDRGKEHFEPVRYRGN